MAMNGPACHNCGATEYHRFFPESGLCSACYQFQRKNGRARTEKEHRVKGGSTGICIVCGQTWAATKKRCETCYRYLRLYGKDRTRRHWARPEKCKICGKPETATRRPNAYGTGIVRGRCPGCRHYLSRHGVERPESFWKANSIWCDCGNRATHLRVPLRTMSVDKGVEREELYDLCEDCWRLENEPLQTKGEIKWNR